MCTKAPSASEQLSIAASAEERTQILSGICVSRMSGKDQNEFNGFVLTFEHQCGVEAEDSSTHIRFSTVLNSKVSERPAHTSKKILRRAISADDLEKHTESVRSSSQILDLKGLASRCMGDEEVMKEVMDSFQKQCSDRIESLEKSIACDDLEKTRFDLDFISGAAKNVGAFHLDTSVEELAAHIKPSAPSATDPNARQTSDGNPSSTPEAQVHLKRVQNEFLLAQKFWKSLHQRATAESTGVGSLQGNSARLKSYLTTKAPLAFHRELGRSESCDSTTVDSDFSRTASTQELLIQSTFLDAQDWSTPEAIALFFAFAKERVDLSRKSFHRGRRDIVLKMVEAVLKYSTAAELKGLSKKSSDLLQKHPDQLRLVDCQQLEQQLDASKAIWDSCGLKV